MSQIIDDIEVKELVQSLPKESVMGSKSYLVKYEDFWFPEYYLKAILKAQRSFDAEDTDIMITSYPKTGTTWLNSLVFAIVNRANHHINNSPLLTHHPHDLVPSLEIKMFNNDHPSPEGLLDDHLTPPRLFCSHIPYTSLPESIKTSECRVLYISRNPFDTLVSQWHFTSKIMKKRNGDFKHYSLEDFLEEFIEGRVPFGPFFHHTIEFWKQSLTRPEKVLFLNYEDLKDDPVSHLKRIAGFLGMPFTDEEENEGVINDIIELCSINKLKELDVNKNGVNFVGLEKTSFFRKGEVGDWTNYFTPPMTENMNKVMQQKLQGTGLTFKLSTSSIA